VRQICGIVQQHRGFGSHGIAARSCQHTVVHDDDIREAPPTVSANQMLTLLRMLLLVIVGTAPLVLLAQDKPNLAGDFRGSLGPLRIKLHLGGARTKRKFKYA
jgi:hypothetical protein